MSAESLFFLNTRLFNFPSTPHFPPLYLCMACRIHELMQIYQLRRVKCVWPHMLTVALWKPFFMIKLALWQPKCCLSCPKCSHSLVHTPLSNISVHQDVKSLNRELCQSSRSCNHAALVGLLDLDCSSDFLGQYGLLSYLVRI